MKKIIKAVAACEDDSIGSSSEGFTEITHCYLNPDHRTTIAYDNKTHVMYVVSGTGAAMPMYNADGSLRIYTEG